MVNKPKRFKNQEAMEKVGRVIYITHDQYSIVALAVEKLNKSEGATMTTGRALELICADYLAGA